MLLRSNVRVWHYSWEKRKGIYQWGHNLVTLVGKTLVAEIIEDSTPPAVPSHIAIGSDATVAAEAHVALQGTEHQRQVATVSRVDNEVTYTAIFTAGPAETLAVGEIGIFNAAAAGVMLARFVPNPFTMDPNDVVTVDWGLQFGD